MAAFSGCKIALILGDEVAAIRRGNVPGIRWPNMWELPGGGREGSETPEACAIREVYEELGIKLLPDEFVYKKEWPAMHDLSQKAWFLVALSTEEMIAGVKFGDEGQEWRMMKIDEFLSRDDAVPLLKSRLEDYLAHRGHRGA